MNRTAPLMMVIVGIVCGLATTVARAESSDVAQLQKELQALRSEVAALKADRGDDWMTERRAEEIKSLVHDVLADADTRASLLEGGVVAGWKKHPFLQTADGGFLLEIEGQIQARYIVNYADDLTKQIESGFEFRRTKLQFSGHIDSGMKLDYAIQLEVNRQTNAVAADKIVIGHKINDMVYVYVAEDKAPFLREEMTSSKRQLAVERSRFNEFYTAGKVQGLGVKISAHEKVKINVMINDGFGSGESSTKNYASDDVDVAVTARVDVMVMGDDWGIMKDFTSWAGEAQHVFVGAAIHYEVGKTGNGGTNDNFLAWTVDASYENNGLNVYAAVAGLHTDNEVAADTDSIGFLVQGGYNIKMETCNIEPFARYEYIDPDTGGNDLNAITGGVNVYFKKHAAKLTVDVVYIIDSFAGSSGLGLRGGSDDEVAFRVQLQLTF